MPGSLHARGAYPPAVVEPLLRLALAASRAGQPLAIAGVQGAGKSTLASQLAHAAARRGHRAAVLSLDDVYLDRDERLRLAREVHPLLATRGPPGTHDVVLACDVLDRLRSGRAARLPRFDKAIDARLPESRWPRVEGCDLVIMEGWCLRVPPQDEAALHAPVNALEAEEDPDGRWRRGCNAALARHYPALWARLPCLALLQAPSFDVVPRWRWEQECAAIAAQPGRAAMRPEDVARFVQHFERLSRHALDVLPALADLIVPLDADRRPQPMAPDATDNRASTPGSTA